MSSYRPSESIEKIKNIREAKQRMKKALNILFAQSGSDGDPGWGIRQAIKILVGEASTTSFFTKSGSASASVFSSNNP